MKRAFTIIELIFVIVILGILAATAIPKFVSVQDDAKISAEQGVAGAVRGGIGIIRGQALIKDGNFTKDGTTYGVTANKWPIDLDIPAGTSALATDAEATFGTVLDQAPENWKVKTTRDTTTGMTQYQGPASSTLATDVAELNTSGSWDYNNTNGVFQYN